MTTDAVTPDAGTTAGFDRGQWSALLVCLAGGFIVFLDVSIVNVALPTISSHLHASGSGLQWIVSGYALAFGLLLVPAGRLGDLHGHRMLFVAGLWAGWARRRVVRAIMAQVGSDSAHVGWCGGDSFGGLAEVAGHELRGQGSGRN
jgi:MFS family permease